MFIKPHTFYEVRMLEYFYINCGYCEVPRSKLMLLTNSRGIGNEKTATSCVRVKSRERLCPFHMKRVIQLSNLTCCMQASHWSRTQCILIY